MIRHSIDIYDTKPAPMKRYLSEYGWHFTRKAAEYAISHMRRINPASNKEERLEPILVDQYKEIMKKYGITPENDIMADGLYVINMGKADYYKRSIPDEQHLAQFVKDTLDDIDAADGNVMRRWYASMIGSGTPVDWEELI